MTFVNFISEEHDGGRGGADKNQECRILTILSKILAILSTILAILSEHSNLDSDRVGPLSQRHDVPQTQCPPGPLSPRHDVP